MLLNMSLRNDSRIAFDLDKVLAQSPKARELKTKATANVLNVFVKCTEFYIKPSRGSSMFSPVV